MFDFRDLLPNINVRKVERQSYDSKLVDFIVSFSLSDLEQFGFEDSDVKVQDLIQYDIRVVNSLGNSVFFYSSRYSDLSRMDQISFRTTDELDLRLVYDVYIDISELTSFYNTRLEERDTREVTIFSSSRASIYFVNEDGELWRGEIIENDGNFTTKEGEELFQRELPLSRDKRYDDVLDFSRYQNTYGSSKDVKYKLMCHEAVGEGVHCILEFEDDFNVNNIKFVKIYDNFSSFYSGRLGDIETSRARIQLFGKKVSILVKGTSSNKIKISLTHLDDTAIIRKRIFEECKLLMQEAERILILLNLVKAERYLDSAIDLLTSLSGLLSNLNIYYNYGPRVNNLSNLSEIEERDINIILSDFTRIVSVINLQERQEAEAVKTPINYRSYSIIQDIAHVSDASIFKYVDTVVTNEQFEEICNENIRFFFEINDPYTSLNNFSIPDAPETTKYSFLHPISYRGTNLSADMLERVYRNEIQQKEYNLRRLQDSERFNSPAKTLASFVSGTNISIEPDLQKINQAALRSTKQTLGDDSLLDPEIMLDLINQGIQGKLASFKAITTIKNDKERQLLTQSYANLPIGLKFLLKSFYGEIDNSKSSYFRGDNVNGVESILSKLFYFSFIKRIQFYDENSNRWVNMRNRPNPRRDYFCRMLPFNSRGLVSVGSLEDDLITYFFISGNRFFIPQEARPQETQRDFSDMQISPSSGFQINLQPPLEPIELINSLELTELGGQVSQQDPREFSDEANNPINPPEPTTLENLANRSDQREFSDQTTNSSNPLGLTALENQTSRPNPRVPNGQAMSGAPFNTIIKR